MRGDAAQHVVGDALEDRQVAQVGELDHRELPPAVEALLLGDRALGRRHGLEPRVGDRIAALDREAVRPVGEALLGALDGRELGAQVHGLAGVELGLVQLRGLVARGLALVVSPAGTMRRSSPSMRARSRARISRARSASIAAA